MAEDLCRAALRGNLDLVKQYVEAGADVNSLLIDWTPLMDGCIKGHYQVVKYLLEKEADVNLRNSVGASALIFACHYNHHAIASLLLDYDADPTFVSSAYGTAELCASKHGWNFNQMKIQSYYRSPLYLDHLFCCAIEEPKKKEIVKKSKKRRREGEEEEKEAEKPFMQKFMAKVIHGDLIFVHRVLPFLFGPYDP